MCLLLELVNIVSTPLEIFAQQLFEARRLLGFKYQR